MEIEIVVRMAMSLLSPEGADLPDPAPGTAEHAAAVASATRLVEEMIRRGEADGFPRGPDDPESSLRLAGIAAVGPAGPAAPPARRVPRPAVVELGLSLARRHAAAAVAAIDRALATDDATPCVVAVDLPYDTAAAPAVAPWTIAVRFADRDAAEAARRAWEEELDRLDRADDPELRPRLVPIPVRFDVAALPACATAAEAIAVLRAALTLHADRPLGPTTADTRAVAYWRACGFTGLAWSAAAVLAEAGLRLTDVETPRPAAIAAALEAFLADHRAGRYVAAPHRPAIAAGLRAWIAGGDPAAIAAAITAAGAAAREAALAAAGAAAGETPAPGPPTPPAAS